MKIATAGYHFYLVVLLSNTTNAKETTQGSHLIRRKAASSSNGSTTKIRGSKASAASAKNRKLEEVMNVDSCSYQSKYFECDGPGTVAICYQHDDHYHNKCVDASHEDIYNKVPGVDLYNEKYDLLNCGCCPTDVPADLIIQDNIMVEDTTEYVEVKYPKSYDKDPYCDAITDVPSSAPTSIVHLIHHMGSGNVLKANPDSMTATLEYDPYIFDTDIHWRVQPVEQAENTDHNNNEETWYYFTHDESNLRLYSPDGSSIALCDPSIEDAAVDGSCLDDGTDGDNAANDYKSQWKLGPDTFTDRGVEEAYHRVFNREYCLYLHHLHTPFKLQLGPTYWQGDNTKWMIL